MYIVEPEITKCLLYLVPSCVKHTTARKIFSVHKTDVILHRKDIISHNAVLMPLSSAMLSQCDSVDPSVLMNNPM
jgi:hypothetical protein